MKTNLVVVWITIGILLGWMVNGQGSPRSVALGPEAAAEERTPPSAVHVGEWVVGSARERFVGALLEAEAGLAGALRTLADLSHLAGLTTQPKNRIAKPTSLAVKLGVSPLVDRARFADSSSTMDAEFCSGVGILQTSTHSLCGSDRPPTCLVRVLVCQGERIYLAATPDGRSYVDNQQLEPYRGQLGDCMVQSVACAGEPQVLETGNSCFLRRLECADRAWVFSDSANGYDGLLEGCRVDQLECGRTVLDYSTHEGVTNSTCNRTDVAMPVGGVCTSGCVPEEQHCVCPLDRMGSRCEVGRPLQCTVRTESPEKRCENPMAGQENAELLDGDPVCMLFSHDDQVEFRMRYECAFATLEGANESLAYDAQFSYYARDGTRLAVSWANATVLGRSEWMPFDFNYLTDRSAAKYEALTPAQVLGQATVQHVVRFSELPDRFFAGNRLYFEVGPATGDGPPTVIDLVYAREFVDFTDLDIQRDLDDGLSSDSITWIIGLFFVAIFILLCLAYWISERIHKWRESRRTKLLEKED